MAPSHTVLQRPARLRPCGTFDKIGRRQLLPPTSGLPRLRSRTARAKDGQRKTQRKTAKRNETQRSSAPSNTDTRNATKEFPAKHLSCFTGIFAFHVRIWPAVTLIVFYEISAQFGVCGSIRLHAFRMLSVRRPAAPDVSRSLPCSSIPALP